MLFNKPLGAILLIAGTCIGAGMLALPISTAPGGFALGLIALVAIWFFMYITGLLVLETNLVFDHQVSYISMAKATLGQSAKWLTWIFFLLLLYALMSAYIMGGSALMVNAAQRFTHHPIHHWVGITIWVFIFALIIYIGAHSVERINKLFMLGLVIGFALLAASITPHMHFIIHSHSHPLYLLAAIPVIITSFGYHIVVPSMTGYLNKNKLLLRRVILLGSITPLVVYLIWEYIVFGNIPVTGTPSLMSILHSGDASTGLTNALSGLTGSYWVSFGARCFAFFALASSFVGVALGLSDLIADGCKIPKTSSGKILIAILTFAPPILIAEVYPHSFILALSYAGIFVAIVHGILPAAMAWASRYRQKTPRLYQVRINKLGLLLVVFISLVVIYAEVATNLHWLA